MRAESSRCDRNCRYGPHCWKNLLSGLLQKKFASRCPRPISTRETGVLIKWSARFLILQMREMRYREVKQLAQGYTANEKQSQPLNPERLTQEPVLPSWGRSLCQGDKHKPVPRVQVRKWTCYGLCIDHFLPNPLLLFPEYNGLHIFGWTLEEGLYRSACV